MVEKITQHKHCIECGRVVSIKKQTCSERCESAVNEKVKKRRLWMFVYMGMIAIFIAILFVQLGGM
jgi:predicted nucleic acid-binding Zn ribbon protein